MNCAYCHTETRNRGQIAQCSSCKSVYHIGCWQENGNKCAVLGCNGAGASVVQNFADVESSESSKVSMTDMKTITCSHCNGKTVCSHGEYSNSCASCLAVAGVSGQEGKVICCICKGMGKISISNTGQRCGHCSGKTMCKHGSYGTSCHSCINEFRQK